MERGLQKGSGPGHIRYAAPGTNPRKGKMRKPPTQ